MHPRAAIVLGLGLACTPGPTHSESSTASTQADTSTMANSVPTSTGEAATLAPTDPATDTSLEPLCGDGVLSGDEICDDGNLEPEDGCDRCAPAPALLWERTVDGTAHRYDTGYGVTFAPDGSLYAVGSEDNADTIDDILVCKFAPDGALLWKQVVAGPGKQQDIAQAVVATADGGAVVVGQLSAAMDVTDTWVRRYSASGEEVWTLDEAAPGWGYSTALGVALDGGAVFVVGREPVLDTTHKATIRRLDVANGNVTWKQEYLAGDSLSAIASDITVADGVLLVAGSRDLSPDTSEATLQRWSPQGDLLSTWSWSDPAWTHASGVSVAALVSGDLLLAVQTRLDSSIGSYIVRFTADGTLVSAAPKATEWSPHIEAVVTDSSDQFVVVGWGDNPIVDVPLNGIFAVYASDGALVIFDAMGDEQTASLRDVAIGPDGLAVVGDIGTRTETDLWIRKLALP